MAATKTVDSMPTTVTALIRLCRAHQDATVTRQDSLDTLNCARGTDAFIERYLAGRTEVSLKKLIPFIYRDHSQWEYVVDVVIQMLCRLKVVEPDESWDTERACWTDHIDMRAPKRKRIVDLG